MRAEIKKIKQSLQNNDLKTAAEQILKANHQIKNYPLLIALEGIYYGETGDLDKALNAFAMAAKTMPRDPTLFYNLGAILRAMGRLKAAEEALQKSLHLNPFNPLVLFELAQVRTLQGKHNEAIMALFKCIETASFFFPAYVAITQYLIMDNQAALAIKLYETAVAGAPNEPFFRARLAELKGL